jgi:hypothetical protein
VTGAGKGQDTTSRRATRTEGRFDGFNLAARSAVIGGHVDAATLPRVNDLLTPESSGADLEYRIAEAPMPPESRRSKYRSGDRFRSSVSAACSPLFGRSSSVRCCSSLGTNASW